MKLMVKWRTSSTYTIKFDTLCRCVARCMTRAINKLYRLHTAACTGILGRDLDGKQTKREKQKLRTFFSPKTNLNSYIAKDMYSDDT